MAEDKKDEIIFGDALIENFGLSESDSDALTALFELNDEDFNQVFPVFLETLKQNITTPAFKSLIFEGIREGKLNKAEMEILVATIEEEVERNETLSDIKKQALSLMFTSILNEFLEVLYDGEKVIVPVEKINDDVKLPQYARNGDAGMDIYALEDYTIKPGETKIIPTGIKVAIPEGYCILLHPRSGQSAKTKLRFANSIGLIDSGFRGEIGVIVENIEPKIKDIEYEFDDNGEIHIKSILHGQDLTISEGQRFAQMRLAKVSGIYFKETNSVEVIGEDRGGGIGSTGAQ